MTIGAAVNLEAVQGLVADKPDPELKVHGSRARALPIAVLGTWVGLTVMAIFGPATPLLRRKLGLNPLEASLLIASPVLSGSLLRLATGPLSDAEGGNQRRMLSTLLALEVTGFIGVCLIVSQIDAPVLPATVSYIALLCLGVIAGCGAAGYSVGIAQVSYWYPMSMQGSALGVFSGLASTGPGVTNYVVPHAFASFGLAATYNTWLCVVAVGAVAYSLLGQNSWYFQLRDQGYSAEEARRAARSCGQEVFPAGHDACGSLSTAAGLWRTWALVSIYFASFGGFISLTGWLPTYWHEFHGVELPVAGSLAAVFSLTTSMSRTFSGMLADRFGGERVALIAFGVAFVGATMMTFSTDFKVDLAGELLMALGQGTVGSASFKLVTEVVPEAVGGAAGLVAGIGAFGGFVLTPVLATFAHSMGEIGYARGFVIYMALFAVNSVVTVVLHAATPKHRLLGDAEHEDDDPESSTTATTSMTHDSKSVPPL